MKRLLYIAFKVFSNLHFGANTKVLSQCRAFESYGYQVELIGRQGTDVVRINTDGSVEKIEEMKFVANDKRVQNLLAKRKQMKTVVAYAKDKAYDACYIRYDFSDAAFIHMLAALKNVCKKIAVEFPTYPYEAENSIGPLNKVKMAIDRHYREQMKKYVDFIVTFYDGHKELFGIPVKVIPNGFDFSTMQLVNDELPDDGVHIIAVSSMREWHGYERFIEGLHQYYTNGGKTNYILHLVGNGREYGKYNKLMERYQLQKHVVMEGAMHGEKLDALYERCAIGIDSLARHRSGIDMLSSLKSREYGAKGLPFINSCRIDIIGDDFPYMLEVPADESPIQIEQVDRFFHWCYDGKTRNGIGQDIRRYIEEKSSMKATLSDVVDDFAKN